jgi:hypothetical protein
MEVSLFLAKLLGIYLLIIAVVAIANKRQVMIFIKDILSSPGLLAVLGIFNILLGLAIVIIHPIWEWNWRGLITLFGYLSIIKGIVRFGFPNLCRLDLKTFEKGYWIIWPLLLILGVYLTYAGFFTVK